MSYTYNIGLRHIVKKDAPFWNCNAIEDVGNAVQSHLKIVEFRAKELFKPNEETLTGTDESVFACEWAEADVAGMIPSARVAAELLEQADHIFEDWASIPYSFDLPGLGSDILIPNLPVLTDSSLNEQLVWHQEFNCRNMEMFGKEKMWIGSLNANILAIESALAEETIDGGFIEIAKAVLSKMKLAQKFDLFFTFRY